MKRFLLPLMVVMLMPALAQADENELLWATVENVSATNHPDWITPQQIAAAETEALGNAWAEAVFVAQGISDAGGSCTIVIYPPWHWIMNRNRDCIAFGRVEVWGHYGNPG